MAAQRRRPHRGLPFVLSAISAAMLLAGCASTHGLTPGGRVIEADSLSSSRSLGTPALSDAAFPAQDWWTTLGDPQLDALIREALQDSPSLAAADARVRQAQAQAGLANAARKDRKITRLNSSH